MEFSWQIILFTFIFMGIVFVILGLIRNKLVFDARQKALNIISQMAKDCIDRKDYQWKRFHDAFDDYGTYNKMFYDLGKWKFEQFYPGIENLK